MMSVGGQRQNPSAYADNEFQIIECNIYRDYPIFTKMLNATVRDYIYISC